MAIVTLRRLRGAQLRMHSRYRPLVALQYCLLSGMICWGKPNMEALILDHIGASGAAADYALSRMRVWFRFSVSSYKTLAPVAGFVTDRAGPKAAGLFGSLLTCLGAYLVAVATDDNGLYGQAFLAFFMANQYVWNSCLWIPRLFPTRSKLVLAVMRIGVDSAQFVPFCLVQVYRHTGLDPGLAVWTFFVVTILELLVPLFFTPTNPEVVVHKQKDDLETGNESKLMLGGTVPMLHQLPVQQQLLTAQFWLFSLFHLLMFVIRSSLINNHTWLIRSIAGASEDDGFLSRQLTLYNLYTAASVPAGLLFGMLADKVGVATVIGLQACLGVSSLSSILYALVFLDSQTSSLALHLFLLLSSLFKVYVIGILYAYMTDVFGFKNVGLLTGIAGFVAGLGVQLDVVLSWLGPAPWFCVGLLGAALAGLAISVAIAVLPRHPTAADSTSVVG